MLALAALLVAPVFPGAGGVAYAGDSFITNLGKSQDSKRGAYRGRYLARPMHTGSHSEGYILTSIDLSIEDAPDDWDTVTVTIRYPTSTTALYTLTNPAALSTGTRRFSAPAGAILGPDTDYWVVIANDDSDADDFELHTTDSDGHDAGALLGWRFRSSLESSNGSTWGLLDGRREIRMRANGKLVPKVTVVGPIKPLPGRYYAEGDVIWFRIVFSETVILRNGRFSLKVRIGSEDRTVTEILQPLSAFDYKEIWLSYEVQPGDVDRDGVSLPANAVSLTPGATLKSRTGDDVDLTHSARGPFRDHKVATDRPTLESAETSTDGGKIILTFSESIHAHPGDPSYFTTREVGVASVNEVTSMAITDNVVELRLKSRHQYGQTLEVMLGTDAVRDLDQKGIVAVTYPVTNNVGALTGPLIPEFRMWLSPKTLVDGLVVAVGVVITNGVRFKADLPVELHWGEGSASSLSHSSHVQAWTLSEIETSAVTIPAVGPGGGEGGWATWCCDRGQ